MGGLNRTSKMISTWSIIIVLIVAITGMFICPNNIDDVYIRNYVVDLVGLIVVFILTISYTNINGFDIFDPFYIVTFIYSFLYFITPMYDIISEEYTWFGYNLFPYGVKATTYSIIGYISLYIGYTKHFVLGRNRYHVTTYEVNENEKNEYALNVPVWIILLMCGICLFANVWYLMHSGFNSGDLMYLLSFGLLGNSGKANTAETSIGFISMLSYSLPTTVLLYWEYGRNKALKIVLFLITMMLQVTRGFRFFVIQIAISFVAYYYIRKRKRPKTRGIFILLFCVLVPVLLMTMFRTYVRDGVGVDLGVVNAESLKEAFDDAIWDNFRIYQNFYGMVGVVPSQYGFCYGRQIIIGTIVMMIPRAIWPGKISSYGGEGLVTLIGSRLTGTGQAYPTIGEYYYALGLTGIVVCMFIYGIWLKSVKRKAENPRNVLDIIEFSVLLGVNLQLLIRGYFPSNFWLIVFSLIPVWFFRWVDFNKES